MVSPLSFATAVLVPGRVQNTRRHRREYLANQLCPVKVKASLQFVAIAEELSNESNHEKQQSILKSINSLVEIIDKIKK